LLKEAGVVLNKAHTHHGTQESADRQMEEHIELSDDDHHNVDMEPSQLDAIIPEAKD
jgi:hypothetical protein